jgi:hypothetical protein
MMNRITRWGLWAGCLLALLGAGPAGATPAKERYPAYGLGSTRGGKCWTYLGSYDDALGSDAACNAAFNHWGQPYAAFRVVRATGLALPPARKYTKILLIPLLRHVKPGATSRGGEFHAQAEAAAAAEMLARAGDQFDVLYWDSEVRP